MKKIRVNPCFRLGRSGNLLKKMKLLITFFLAGLLTVSASTYSQQTKLSINLEEVTVKEAFKLIEKKSEFVFFYNEDYIDANRKVSINATDEKIEIILNELLKGTQNTFKIYDRQIVILSPEIKESPSILKSETNAEQKKLLSGTVKDSKGLPLPGVSIVVKGTTIGDVTDSDGKFRISVPLDAKTLTFSFVGMKTQEIIIGNNPTINVTLDEEAASIDEVVAVGYGTQKKANLTGAVGVASSERLENRTITSIGQGLQGVIPGLNIAYKSGDPNEKANFNIRGIESINGGGPLILVDGVPMDVEKVNPNDIKSVSVLKDASSAAIYGARAAFGVILVETKKGQVGKININFSAQLTAQKAIFPGYEPIGNKESGTARQIYDAAYRLTRGVPLLPPAVIDAALAYQKMDNPTADDAWLYDKGILYPLGNTYMKDLAMRDYSPQKQYDFSITGASEKASYYVSLGVVDKQGFLRYGNEDYKRYNALSKVEFQVNKWLTMEEKISFTSVVNDNPHNYNDQWYYQSISKHFYTPYIFPDLTYYVEPGDHDKWAPYIGMYIDNRNPIPYLKKGGRDTQTDNEIWLTQSITITPLKGLKINGDFSYQYFWSDNEKVQSRVDVLRGFDGFEMTNDIVLCRGKC